MDVPYPVSQPTGLEPPKPLGPAEPPLQRGETVLFGDERMGIITRAYVLEDKYAVKEPGSNVEVKGPNNSFFYFRRMELRRVALPPAPTPPPGEEAAENGEPPQKQAKVGQEAEGQGQGENAADSNRLRGRMKWYSKEKGFGKIQPSKDPGAEEVFVHKNQIEGGPDGPHAQAIAEGVLVSYEVTIGIDGKPCACNVQVERVSRALAAADAKMPRGSKEELLRRLLSNGLQIGHWQEKGVGHTTMEDRFIIRSGVNVETLGAFCKKAVCSFFGVFDGHSGASCSDFVATSLDRAVFECVRHQSKREVSSEMAMRSALQAAFRTTEHNFFQYMNRLEGGAAHAWGTAGSTACTATFFGPDEECRLRLAIANAGDSRAVLGRKDGKAVRLSEDHTPNIPGERKRIETEGAAVVLAQGIWRIVLPSKKGTGFAGLSVSRGFGDLEYKQPAGVVSAVPDVFMRTIDLREDSFVIIASDGIWGPISDAEAVRIVATALREGGEDGVKHAARQLVEQAHVKDCTDDKTVLVIFFGDMPSAAATVASTPQYTPPVRLPPRQVLLRPVDPSISDDMFAVGRPLAQAVKPRGEMAELDDLLAGYAQEVGQVKRRF